jgi:UDP-N-acetylmuramoylalanine--D-glutamate ligase
MAALRIGGASDTLNGIPAAVLHPVVPATVAVITNIFRDHQDYYPSMSAYVEDKREVYRHLPPDGIAIFPADDEWSPTFIAEARRRVRRRTGCDRRGAPLRASPRLPVRPRRSQPPQPRRCRRRSSCARRIPRGNHHCGSNLSRGSAPAGDRRAAPPLDSDQRQRRDDSGGRRGGGSCFRWSVFLIAGGSDKGLDPAPLVEAAHHALARGGAIFLLDGSATPALSAALRRRGSLCKQPFRTLAAAFAAAQSHAEALNRPDAVILLSPVRPLRDVSQRV